MSRFLVPLLIALLNPPPFSPPAAAVNATSFGDDEGRALIIVRGRAVCLDAAGRPVDSLFACNETDHRFGFSAKEGKLYKFLPADSMTAIFTDIRVRQRELQITARLAPGDRLEIIKVQSVKEGKLYDIFYFCEICNIKSYLPGLCPCCRNELEFRETAP